MYDEKWLKDFILQDMSVWERVDIVRFYDNYSIEGSYVHYGTFEAFEMMGFFYITVEGREEEFGTNFLEGVSYMEIESDNVKEELLKSIEMMLL